jgi:translocation and assembly module TamB
MTETGEKRKRHRWRWVFLGIVLTGLAVVAALPWVLALPPAQKAMRGFASRLLAPSSVEFDAVRLSWTQPTRIEKLVLADPAGLPILTSGHAEFEWSLRDMLFNRSKKATLTFHDDSLDVERAADGTINIYETLRPVIKDHPPIRLIVKFDHGKLRYRDPLFAEPVLSDDSEIELDLGMDLQPISWSIALNRPGEAGAGASQLEIQGEYSRANVATDGQHELALSLKGKRWPWSIAKDDLKSTGQFSGSIELNRRSGRVVLAGETALAQLVLSGGPLAAPDTIRLDEVTAHWKAALGDGIWSIDRLELRSPIVTLAGSGIVPSTTDRGITLDGTINLALLARQLPATLHLREGLEVKSGAVALHAELTRAPDGRSQVGMLTGKLTDLAASLRGKSLAMTDPASFAARAMVGPRSAALERLDIQTPYLKVTGQGDLDQGLSIAATLDLAVFRSRFHDWVDLGDIELAGTGKLDGRYQRKGAVYQASAALSLRDLKLGGLPAVDRFERSNITVDARANGPAAAPGWPSDWSDFSLAVRDGLNDLKCKATLTPSPRLVSFDGSAQAQFEARGARHQLSGEWKAAWDADGVSADRIALALVPVTKWGPGIGAGDPLRWTGRARYRASDDELTVESLAPEGAVPGRMPATVAQQSLRLKGLRDRRGLDARLDADVDLAPVDKYLRPDDRPVSGHVVVAAHAKRQEDDWEFGSRLELREPARAGADGKPITLGGDLSIRLDGRYAAKSDRLDLGAFGLNAPYIQLDGAGSIAALSGRPRLDLKGNLSPDWKRLSELMAAHVEPRARISGLARPWRLAGTIESLTPSAWPAALDGEIGLSIEQFDVFGMKMGVAPMVLRSSAGRLTIDPIDTTLNGGKLRLEPVLNRGEDGVYWLQMGPSSGLEGAVVNDEVSHRVLSYVAPILDGATRVDGAISLSLVEASMPILGPPEEKPYFEGDLAFNDVRFLPGPLAEELLSVFRLDQKPLLVLRDTISVQISDGKVRQEGLVIPVGKLASIGLDGSVDFDKNLDLVARFAMAPGVDNVPVLSPILEAARFELPIKGTLEKPKIDGDALKDKFKNFGTGLLGGGIQMGIEGLDRVLRGVTVPPFRGMIPGGRKRTPTPAGPARGVPAPPTPAGGAAARSSALPDPKSDANVGRASAPRPGERPAGGILGILRSAGAFGSAERKAARQERRAERQAKKADRQAGPTNPDRPGED